MKDLYFKVVLTLSVLAIVAGQDFPPIDSQGKLMLLWDKLQMNDTQFQQAMNNFQQVYSQDKLKSLYMTLYNNNFTTMEPLSVLGNYYLLNSVSVAVYCFGLLQSIQDIVKFPTYNQMRTFSLQLSEENPQDWQQFFYNIRNLNELDIFQLQISSTELDQKTHDNIYAWMQLYVNPDITSISIGFFIDKGLQNSISILLLGFFPKLTDLSIGYGLSLDQKNISTPIVQLIASKQSLQNVIIQLNIQYEQDWINYVSKFTFLTSLTLKLIYVNADNLAQSYPKLFANLGQLNSLQNLTLTIQSLVAGTYDGQVLLALRNMHSLKFLQMSYLFLYFSNYPVALLNASSQMQVARIQISATTLDKSCLNILIPSPYLQELSYELDVTSDLKNCKISFNIYSTQLTIMSLKFEGLTELDIMDLQISKYQYLSQFYLQFEQYDNFTALDNLKNLQNLNSLTIILSHDEQSSVNISFYDDFNYIRYLITFNNYYTGDQYIVVNSDNKTYTLQSCDQTCFRCFGPSSNQCTSCLVDFLYENQCMEQCPQGYHPNYITRNCDKDTIIQQKLLEIN